MQGEAEMVHRNVSCLLSVTIHTTWTSTSQNNDAIMMAGLPSMKGSNCRWLSFVQPFSHPPPPKETDPTNHCLSTHIHNGKRTKTTKYTFTPCNRLEAIAIKLEAIAKSYTFNTCKNIALERPQDLTRASKDSIVYKPHSQWTDENGTKRLGLLVEVSCWLLIVDPDRCWTEAIARRSEAIASSLEAIASGWRPSLLGWRPSLLGWRKSPLGWRPLLLGWRPALLGWRPPLLGWGPSLLGLEAITIGWGWKPSLVGWRPLLGGWRQ